MAVTLAVSVLLSMFASASAAPGAPARRDTARADTSRVSPRVVRRFPAIEVRAPLHDLRSSETVRMISSSAMRALPIDNLADAVALQAGVVAHGEELHVRGGRSGETAVTLDGLSLNEPLRRRAVEVPLLALRSVDLVSGAPEAQYGSGLAGTLDLRTADPGERFSGEWRWQSDGGPGGDRYDRVSGRMGAPLHLFGLGVVAAGDATLDDSRLPDLRSAARTKVAGRSFDWRADNRVLGYVKLAPANGSRRFVAQALVGRHLQRPYDPAWSLDGWVVLPAASGRPIFFADSQPGAMPYRAADHLAITDERQFAALVSVSTMGARRHGTLSLGWLRTRTVTSVSGQRGAGYVHADGFFYGDPRGLDGPPGDPFRVIWGDYPLLRESGSDAYTLRGDGEMTTRGGGVLKAGAGATLEHATLYELDGTVIRHELDSLRTYDASAPGAFGYVQGRWSYAGLVMNTGLRVEYFTAGPEGGRQTLPGSARGIWSLSPRLGLTYPISVRDAFSMAYVRVQQDPGRDFLYDRRRLIPPRQPLGNPALLPATVISYEASVKHLFSAAWAAQTSVFFRNVWGQVGARNYYYSPDVAVQYYTNDDEASALGFEWSLLHADEAGRRLELHYTWLQAWGSESRPEGDPYGPIRGSHVAPIADVPLSWDRRHTLLLSGALPLRHGCFVSWATTVGSPLPWTPKERGEPLTDVQQVNSRRFQWTETTSLDVRWSPRLATPLTLALEVRNLFDHRGELYATVDGYPNPVINTLSDDYGAYRTETGNAGGAYWMPTPDGSAGHWVPVNDPRLFYPPRSVRFSVGLKW
jgi:outer membrane receptor protein involved in Fe transport